jgi:uncharacterized protein
VALPFLLCVLLLLILGVCSAPFTDERTRKALELMSLGWQSPLFFLLSVVIIVPFFEELIYRGYLFRAWIESWGFARTALFGSLLFALPHFHYGWSGLLFVFILGYMLFYLRWKTQSLIPCLILHLLNNAWSLSWLHKLQ